MKLHTTSSHRDTSWGADLPTHLAHTASEGTQAMLPPAPGTLTTSNAEEMPNAGQCLLHIWDSTCATTQPQCGMVQLYAEGGQELTLVLGSWLKGTKPLKCSTSTITPPLLT